jgi:hypothetical protein
MLKMDKSLIMRSFNSHFNEFMKDVLLIFPDNQDLKKGLTAFEVVKHVHPTMLIKAWYLNVYLPYISEIEKGDISFFYIKNYEDDLNDLSNAKEIMNIIDKLREPIRSMDDVSKQHTMKYLQNLCELSKLYKL